jgi:hypothetical protein
LKETLLARMYEFCASAKKLAWKKKIKRKKYLKIELDIIYITVTVVRE